MADDIKEPDRAEKLIRNVLEKAEEAEVKKKVLFRLAGLYGKTGKTDEFVDLADDLAKNHDLKYADLNDREGRIIFYHRGFDEGDEVKLEEEIKKLLMMGQSTN